MAEKDLTEILKRLGSKALQRAGARALSKAAVSTRAEVVRRVRATIKLKAKDVRDVIAVGRAKPGPLDGMKSTIVVAAKAVPLYQFGALRRNVKTSAGPRVGVTVNVKGTRKIVRGAFIATMKNGKTGVFMRGRKAGAGKKLLSLIGGSSRLPIRMLFSSSVQQVVSGDEFQEGILLYAEERVQTILEQELNFEYTKL